MIIITVLEDTLFTWMNMCVDRSYSVKIKHVHVFYLEGQLFAINYTKVLIILNYCDQ